VTINQDEISTAIQQFISAAYRYEANALGVVDKNDTYNQLRESIIITLLSDPNAPFHFLAQGVRDEITRVNVYVSLLERLLSTLQLLSPKRVRDNIQERELAQIEKSLDLLISDNSQEVRSRLSDFIDATSSRLIRNLTSAGAISVSEVKALSLIESYIAELEDIHDLIFNNIESILAGIDSLVSAPFFVNVRERVLLAAKSLILSMRIERNSSDDTEAVETSRQRFIELQAAKTAINMLSNPVDYFENRLLSGAIPAKNELTVSATGQQVLQHTSDNSGGFDVQPDTLLQISTDSNPLQDILLKATSRIDLIAEEAAVEPLTGRALYLAAEYSNFPDGPYDVEILELTPYYKQAVIRYSVSKVIPSACMACICRMSYIANKGLLSSDSLAAVNALESQIYRVVGYSGTDRVIDLDPVFPSVTGVLPASGWQATFTSPLGRWQVPEDSFGYGDYLSKVQDLVSGPSADDVLQPWRIHTRVTGNFSTSTEFMKPGERVTNASGSKQGIVICHLPGVLYLHPMSTAFSLGETITGRKSLIVVTNTVAVVSDLNGNEGQVNTARWVDSVAGDKLHLRGRTSSISGTDATIDDGSGSTGNNLTLALSPGERGLFSGGIFDSDAIVVDGTIYTITRVLSETTALISGDPVLIQNKTWECRVSDQYALSSLTVLDSGVKWSSQPVDVSSYVAGAPSSGYETGLAYVVWNHPSASYEQVFADNLGLRPFTRAEAKRVPASTIVDEINAANVSGLIAEISTDLLERFPGNNVVLTSSKGSQILSVSDGEFVNDVGFYIGSLITITRGKNTGLSTTIIDDRIHNNIRELVLDVAVPEADVLSGYLIESSRVRLRHSSTDVGSKINFGSGTGHALLGLPENTTLESEFDLLSVRNGDSPFDVEDRDVSIGDEVELFRDTENTSKKVLTITAIDGSTLSVSPAVSGEVQKTSFRIKGKRVENWELFQIQIESFLLDAEISGTTKLNKLKELFTPVFSARKIQQGDVSALKRVVSKILDDMNSLRNILASLNIDPVVSAKPILEALTESGFTAARRLLVTGRYIEFFECDSVCASLAGSVQQKIGDIRQSLLATDSIQQIEDSEEPVAVIELEQNEDTEDGFRGDQLLDDNDDGELEL
jgi:hypothetical protein